VKLARSRAALRQRRLLFLLEGRENPELTDGGVGVRAQSFPPLAGQPTFEQVPLRRREAGEPFRTFLQECLDLAVENVTACLEQVVRGVDFCRRQFQEFRKEGIEADSRQRMRLARLQRKGATGFAGGGCGVQVGGRGHGATILLLGRRARDSGQCGAVFDQDALQANPFARWRRGGGP
jgi:hypothetical protein